ncbi:hypothetical protein pipiens_020060, partial [Culex pipiens pipiens]
MGGSFSSVATTPSLSCPMGTSGSGLGIAAAPPSQPPASAPAALSSAGASPFQSGIHPAYTTRNRPEVATEQRNQQQNQRQQSANQLSMPNSTGKNNHHLSQAVIESERSDLLNSTACVALPSKLPALTKVVRDGRMELT